MKGKGVGGREGGREGGRKGGREGGREGSPDPLLLLLIQGPGRDGSSNGGHEPIHKKYVVEGDERAAEELVGLWRARGGKGRR